MTTDLEISYQAMLVYVDIQMLKKLFFVALSDSFYRTFWDKFKPHVYVFSNLE